jgi:pimeloyl-ACP methyl ester carboxylesterase
MTDAPRPSALSTVSSKDGTQIAYRSYGAGEGIIIVGGVLSTGEDYVRLAEALTRNFAVHVVDRRGRGRSGPQGADYSVEAECEDLLAVQAATSAVMVFGHSYGGFVALEAARQTQVFSRVVVYEPGVCIGGSLPTGWMPRYRELLAAGRSRAAFACFARAHALWPISAMPLWYLQAILRLVIRGDRWRTMEPLLATNLAEHEQEVRLDDGTASRYASIESKVLLLGGAKSKPLMTTRLFEVLQGAIPDSSVEILAGLDHFAPDQKAPEVVADHIREFLL